MKVLITGADGFIGKELSAKLKEKNFTIISASRINGINLTKWDIVKAIDSVDVIIHLAAKTSVQESFLNPREYYYNNLASTINTLELARISKSKVIFLSSYFYGPPQYIPVDEVHPLSPHNPYSSSKLLSEEICKGYSRDHDVDSISLRLFNIYGKEQKGNFLIPDIINQIKSGKVILNDPRPKRDYIHISDVINAIYNIIKADFRGFDCFNLGTGESHSVEKIVNLIKKYCPDRFEFFFKNIKRRGEVLDSVADIKKIKKAFDWQPNIGIEEGIKLLF